MQEPEQDGEVPEEAALAVEEEAALPERPPPRMVYRVDLTLEETMARIAGEPRVLAIRAAALPEFGSPVKSRPFTMELRERSFRMHVARTERGRSGSGMLPVPYLVGRLREEPDGAVVEVDITYARPSWAIQRAIGMAMSYVAGMVWVAVGAGEPLSKLGLYVAFVLFTSPLLVNDLLHQRRSKRDEAELLSLLEGVLGPVAIGGAERGSYRRPRALPVSGGDTDASDEDHGQ